MKQIDRKRAEAAINLLALLAAVFAVCRIVAICYSCGTLYTFGIFYLAILCGIYCIFKALWNRKLLRSFESAERNSQPREAQFFTESEIPYVKVNSEEIYFFTVRVRALLALFFTGMQVLGLYYSIPGIGERVHTAEVVLWVLCLTPLTYSAQNLLFARVAVLGGKGGETSGQACSTDHADHPAAEEVKQMNGGFHVRRHFLCAYGVILAGFMIPFAAYYPAIMAYDVIPQLDQIRVSGYTTHHPLIHTLMLSMSLKIGEILPFVNNADRAGLAVYTILQMLIVAGGFAYVYVFLRRKGVHRYVCYLFVLCAAFYPTHGMLAVSITKDTIYAVLVMLFTVFVWDLVTWEEGTEPAGGWLCAYLVLTVLLLLFRNNSIYAWILFVAAVSPVLWKIRRNNGKFFRTICMTHVSALALYLILNLLMITASHATNTTYAREMLSVPAQQIARVIAYHAEELTEKDMAELERVWGEDNLPEYVPAIADRSKRDLSNDKDVLKTLAKEWVSLGIRYPQEYIRAFLIKNKGMWYLEDSTYLNDIYSYAKGYLQITYPSDQQEYVEALVPGYARHQKFQILQSIYRYFAGGDEVWRYVPPLALVMQPAFYLWALFYYCVCCIGLKKGTWLLPAVYLLALAGTLLLGPCVLVRYLYPVMLAVTVLILTAASALRRENTR